ncbi:MAG: Crp/Fnr family transcriptional regulator [Bacteroidales bacterium]|nr:Crp/Fnr family transcriptional regulator [Bacteroidales bacterium]
MNDLQEGFTCSECIEKCSLFKALTKDELEEVYEHRYDTTFRSGEVIAKQGSPISHIVSLSTGLAKLVLETPGKPDILLTVVKPTTLITSPGMFLDNRYHFSIVSIKETKACFISMTIIRQLFERNHEFAKRFHRSIGERSIMLYNRFRNIIHKNMAGRIADSILFLHKEIYGELNFKIDLNRSELAEYSNMTKESVSRILKELKDEGIFDLTSDHATILNLDRLEQIAKNG